MSVKGKLSRLLARGRRKPGEHSITHTKIDAAVLRDVLKRAPKLEEAFNHKPEFADREAWRRLGEDVFFSYFTDAEPQVVARDDLDPRFHVNREVASRHLRDDRTVEERPHTRGNPVAAALGTLGALNALRQSYNSEFNNIAQDQAALGDIQDDLDAVDEFMAQLREQRQQAPNRAEDIDAQMREAAKSKRELTGALADAVESQRLAAGDIAKEAEHMATYAAIKGAESAEAALQVPGVGKGAGAGSKVSIDTMIRLADRVSASPVIKDVLDMMGRLELSMGSTRREKRKGGFEDIVDIELGNDLAVVLPQEKVLMMHPMGRMDFFRRFGERSLAQYETVEQRELKRGPLVFLCDGSQSMDGMRNVFARGLTLASVSIAHREGRDAIAIEFSGVGQVRGTPFPKDRPLNPEHMVAFAEQFYRGGTSTLSGMREARDIIKHQAPFHAADLVVMTDGQDNVAAEDIEIRDELNAMGVRIHGISIACAPTDYLLTICEKTTPVYDFAGPNEATHRLAIDLT